MTQGGAAQPVVVSAEAPSGGPAIPIAVIAAPFWAMGGNPIKVVEVTDNRARVAGAAVPVYLASGAAASTPIAGPPIPVYVVSGSLNPHGASLLLEDGSYLLLETGGTILLE